MKSNSRSRFEFGRGRGSAPRDRRELHHLRRSRRRTRARAQARRNSAVERHAGARLFDAASDALSNISNVSPPSWGPHITNAPGALRRGSRLGARLADRLEIHALRPAAVGVPHAAAEPPRIPRPSSCARSRTGLRHRHPSNHGAVPANPGFAALSGRRMIDYGCGSGISVLPRSSWARCT
jgi:hypothetical protein